MADMDHSRAIADWVVNFSLRDAPRSVLHHADRSILDVIGVSLAGSDHASCRKLRAFARGQYGPGDCTVLGRPDGGSACAAALVNGTASHVLDFDDVSYDGMVHASAVVWPAVWAAAELAGASGGRTREAFIAAVEVHCALGRAFTHELFWRGFWTTGLLGSAAAAAGAAKALSLDAEATRCAIEIALTQASGLRAIVGTPMKAVACGIAAEAGMRAALFARDGIEGAPLVAGHPQGFAAMLNGGLLHEEAITGLGTRYVLSQAPMAFKQYPICSYGQAAVEALCYAQAELGSPPIEVVCEVPASVLQNMPYDVPSTTTQAQFSVPFALSAVLAFSSLAPTHLNAKALADPTLLAALKRVTVRVATGNSAESLQGCGEGAVVTATSSDGRTVTQVVREPLGMPQRPLSDEQLQAKFQACVAPLIGAAAATRLSQRIASMDALADIRGLLEPSVRDALAASDAFGQQSQHAASAH